MRHIKKNRKFGRVKKQRKALLKHLTRALILNEKIKTTEAKAKSLRPLIEKLITKSKNKNLSNLRYLNSRLPHMAAKKLFDVIGEKYKEKNGGYTRIIKLPPRSSDGAKMALIEFV